MQLISETYRDNFNKSYKKDVLRKCCNVMMYDDHEIVDTYKSVNLHSKYEYVLTPKLEQLLLNGWIYYQRSLYANPDVEMDLMYVEYADARFILPDLIKYRQHYTSTDDFPTMGKAQFDTMVTYLRAPAKTYMSTSLMFTSPLLASGRAINHTLSKFLSPDWLSEFSGTPSKIKERDAIVLACTEATRNKNNGFVYIISGDSHYSEFSMITDDQLRQVPHFISSPMSSQIMPDAWIGWVNTATWDRVHAGYITERSHYLSDYNYVSMFLNESTPTQLRGQCTTFFYGKLPIHIDTLTTAYTSLRYRAKRAMFQGYGVILNAAHAVLDGFWPITAA